VRKGYAPFSKSRLKAERRTQVGGIRTSTNKAIRSLDPDAESRGEGKWDSEDSSYAKALHRTLFEYARAGELDAAFDLARQADQPWKAASLRGAILYHQALDSADDMMDGDDFEENVGGNRNRLLWKAVCRKLAASPTLDVYEKALYGSLAGQLQGPLAVSDTWEEHLWAHLNAAFEARIDEAFESEDAKTWWSQEGGGSIKVMELKSSSGDPHAKETVRAELKSIFERVKGTEKGSVNLQANNLYHVVQEAVILDGVDELLIHVESRLPEMRATLEPKRYVHVARFFSHLIIYFRLLHRPLPASTCNSILRHYVEALEHAGEDELVAMYASSLERESAEETYARFLASLNIDMPLAERQTALLRAKEHSLDTASVARLVVQIIFGEAYPAIAMQTLTAAHGFDPLAALNTELTEVEARLISAIDWLTFDESTRADAVFQSNALMRLFLSSGKLHAARTTLYSLPESVVADLDDMLDLTFGDKSEHLNYRQFFSALSASLSFREVLSKQPSRASKLEAHTWREALSSVLATAKEASLEVLTGDWLKLAQADDDEVDATANREEAERRLVELARIRQIYIPELILRLHFMFFDTREVLGGESLRFIIVDLPILVADERYRLYLEFVTREGGNRLKEYLEHVRRANIESLA
jgi:nuclear pore complex protein Nup107